MSPRLLEGRDYYLLYHTSSTLVNTLEYQLYKS